jgi:hypothetical protein
MGRAMPSASGLGLTRLDDSHLSKAVIQSTIWSSSVFLDGSDSVILAL